MPPNARTRLVYDEPAYQGYEVVLDVYDDVFAPQTPFHGRVGEDSYRRLIRKSHPLKQSIWSMAVRQHEQMLAWLASLPFVKGDRIAFYGLPHLTEFEVFNGRHTIYGQGTFDFLRKHLGWRGPGR